MPVNAKSWEGEWTPRTDRVACVLRELNLPRPLPGAEWHRDAKFNAAEEILAHPELRDLFRTAIEKGVVVVSRPERQELPAR